MFWETELRTLAARKRRLTGQIDLERAVVQVHAQAIGHSLRWVETLQGWFSVARPALWLAASVAGLVLGRRLSGLARWSSIVGSLRRGFRIAWAPGVSAGGTPSSRETTSSVAGRDAAP